jgi:signal transduction histidine kinase
MAGGASGSGLGGSMGMLAIGILGGLAFVVALAFALHAAARVWLRKRLSGHRTLLAERSFGLLVRAAREAPPSPQRYAQLLAQLLSELFEPLEVLSVERVPVRSRVIGGGSALLVPMRGPDEEALPTRAVALRFARHGERPFTPEDARLADRVVDHLRRAVARDQAVESGRTEERQRIAQDLHDDIGARLLTLMYQAPTPELEDYIRRTLQDLKTLTRGLAATEQRLSYAAAEWKADLTQRLTAAQVSLGWSVEGDIDRVLTVVQWSALTRVLRELVTNALFHGHASRIEVGLVLLGSVLSLHVADDGRGRQPEAWAQGLGQGGVRKRVKLLGGEVTWRENEPCGIVCTVRVPEFGSNS